MERLTANKREIAVGKTHLFKIIDSMLCALALLSACSPGNSGDSSGHWIGADDALEVDADGYLRNRKGRELVLRGVNLGGWMLQESWMCPVFGRDREWANLDTIRAMEDRGWTAAQIQELFDTYQDNWITVDDFDFFKAQGVNSIRIPFWYRNFMSDEAGAWINNDDGSGADTANPGFRRLDWAITQAKKRGIYVILDMHGVPGGQSMDHSCGTIGKNEVYTNAEYEQITVDLWAAIARRYKDEPAVAAYDLLNEPQNNGGFSGPNAWAPGSNRAIHETVRLYDRLYREIRAVDPDTIVIMEGIWSMNLPNPAYVHSGAINANERYSGKQTAWDRNVMYSMHIYDHGLDTKSPPSQGGTINYRVYELTEARKKWGVAVHVGEFNNDGQGNQAVAYQLYNDSKISWNMWTYKIAGANMGNWSLYQSASKPKANPQTDNFETIKEKWGETLRTFNAGTNDPANGYTRMRMSNMYAEGQSHTISGVFTNSNQSGFPAGGKSVN
jgi:aryl-phospho-beta-D-glucosidase BglC (GH1 family)